MSYGIAVQGLDAAGGAQLNGGQSFFTVSGANVVLLGDPVAGHGLPPHAAPVMAAGSSWMDLNGIPVCRAGHTASCGHASSGRDWFVIPD
jgi:uncharacterized Zn-binding protein involved in type VI secretion